MFTLFYLVAAYCTDSLKDEKLAFWLGLPLFVFADYYWSM